MSSTLEGCGGADLEGGTGARDDQADVVVAVVQDLGDAVMQEADADDALAGAHVLGGAGAGLGVHLDVLVQVHQVLDALVLGALLLDHGVHEEQRGTGGVVVGQPDQTLVLLVQQVVVVLGGVDAQAVELLLVVHDAQDALVDAVPVVLGGLVDVVDQVAGVLGLHDLEQALLGGHVVRIGGAAEPHVAGRLAALLLDLGKYLLGGQTLVGGLDAVELLEVATSRLAVVLLAGDVDDELALVLRGLDQVSVGADGIGTSGATRGSAGRAGAAARGEAQRRDAGSAQEAPTGEIVHTRSPFPTKRWSKALVAIDVFKRIFCHCVTQR